MNYDDQWLLKQIKRLQEQLSLVESRLGSITSITNNIGPVGNISYMEIRSTPSIPEPAPADPTKIWFLSFDDGSSGLVWNVTNQAWQ